MCILFLQRSDYLVEVLIHKFSFLLSRLIKLYKINQFTMKSFIKPDIICIIITPLFDVGYYTLKATLYSK